MVATRNRPRCQRDAFGPCQHQPATGYLKVQRFVQVVAVTFHEHVFPGDAQVGAAVQDVGRHVGGADDDQPDSVMIGVEHEFAGCAGVLEGLQPGARE